MRYTREELENFVVDTKNCYEFLENINVNSSPGNFNYWKAKLKSEGIDISHWIAFKSYSPKKTPDQILTNNQNLKFRIAGATLKSHLLKTGAVYKCSSCGIDEWNGIQLSLHIDHINGDWRNNTPENLQFLCPNCHSQTESYCGKKNKREDKLCPCGVVIKRRSTNCKKCCYKNKTYTGGRGRIRSGQIRLNPTKDILEKLVWEKPTTHIAKDYGVSDKAVNKWCKKYNISKPPRGYWTKFKTK